MIYRQFTLTRLSTEFISTLVTWLPEKHGARKIEEGDILTIKGKEGTWVVESISWYKSTSEEMRASRLHRDRFGSSLKKKRK